MRNTVRIVSASPPNPATPPVVAVPVIGLDAVPLRHVEVPRSSVHRGDDGHEGGEGQKKDETSPHGCWFDKVAVLCRSSYAFVGSDLPM